MGDALFEVGELVGGIYEIKGLLGSGGMGSVYVAQDVVLSRKVALKACVARLAPTLIKEAQALASIRHPGMIDVHSSGTHRGLPYIVMEHLPGVDLETFLSKRLRDSGPLTIAEVLDILTPIADALTAVHSAGLAHRDVKPANIMLMPSGRIVLMDFGLFQPEHAGEAVQGGTPEYMGPESISSSIDPRSAFLLDVYALGITAFELLTGDVPFHGEPMWVLAQHSAHPVPDLREVREDVPVRFAALVAEMVAKDPMDRPSSMEAILFRLRALRQSAPRSIPVPKLGSLDVLVVDDDPTIAGVVGRYVSRALAQPNVVLVNDAERALASAQERPPHVMLVDLHMPRVSGVELCMMLRRLHLAEDSTVILLGAPQESDAELLRQNGVTRFLPKDAELSNRLGAELRAIQDERRSAVSQVRGTHPSTESVKETVKRLSRPGGESNRSG
jgi:serine/threonine-protein kinase